MPKRPSSSRELTIPTETIESKIYAIRGHKVMLDRDLAALYGVPTKRLNEQVKRNRKRFPEHFMFQLTEDKAQSVSSSRSQNATLKRSQNIKYQPNVFTEHGVVMLSSVLNSERAIQVSILVVNVFVRLREMLASNKDLAHKFEKLEQKQQEQGEQITAIIDTINELLLPEPVPPKRRIGFNPNEDEQGSTDQ